MRARTVFRVACAGVLAVVVACEGSPTQPSRVVPPAPPSPPAAPPAPPPGFWSGFVLEKDGSVLDIGGSGDVLATAINDSGHVVGTLSNGHAFIWTRTSGITDIGTIASNQARAMAVNSNDEVVGTLFNNGPARAFKWTAATGLVVLSVPDFCQATRASDINDDGDIVGNCSSGNNGILRPVLWNHRGGADDLGAFGSDLGGIASEINDRGEIVGESTPETIYDNGRAVIWRQKGFPIPLGPCTPETCDSMASTINNRGDLAGYVNGTLFVQIGGTFKNIGALSGSQFNEPTEMNDSGAVVGVSYPTGLIGAVRSWIWTPDAGLQEMSFTFATETFVTGINNKGEIVGYGRR